MKKYIFLATALAALVSCSENEFVGDENITNTSQNEQGAIAFGTGLKTVTRGDKEGADAAALLNNNFVVEGFKWNGNDTKEEVFDHYNVNWKANTANTTTSNTSNWEYVAQAKHTYGPAGNQTIKYWDYSKTQYDFIAYSAGKDNTAVFAAGDYNNGSNVYITEITPATMTSSTGGAYTIKGKAANLAKVYIADLVTAYRDETANDAAGDYQDVVTLKFRSLSAKVRIGLYETVPGYSVKDVVFYSDDNTRKSPTNPATWGDAYLYTKGGDVFNEEGTYIVYFPTTGSANKTETDYNKAHLAFTAEETSGTSKDKAFGKLTGSLEDGDAKLAIAENAEAAGNLYLGRSSNAAIFAGNKSENYYTVVIPNETGAVLNLKVDYKLVSTDGSGEIIQVTGATAKVPAVYASWKSGYAYTYLFKISQNTNGLTNPSIDIKGLYPITFDAVVMNSEVDGVQETITTVADPSITTYAKGKVVTSHDEYTTSDNIYVMVENGTSNLAVGNTANLYTVTLESGAAQTINEASVANAFKNGKPTYDAGTVLTAETALDGYYTLASSTYTPCASGDKADGSTTYYKKTADYAVKDANEKTMALTSATLKDVTEIASGDSPTGNAIPINGVMFKPAAAGTYAFQYAKTITTAATYKAATGEGGKLIAGNTYYTSSTGEGLFIADGTEDIAGKYEINTPAVVSEWIYKIIKVE